MIKDIREFCGSCGAKLPENSKKCPKCGAKVSTEKIKYVSKPTIVTSSFIAEQIWDRKNAPKYLVYHFDTGKIDTVQQIDLGEEDLHGKRIIYTPIDNESLRKGLVIVPINPEPCEFADVFKEADFFSLFCYDPCGKEAMLKLLVRICIGSWFLDRFVMDPKYDIAGSGKFAPIIPIRGPSQSGKNRLAFVLRMLSYRPYFEMSTYRVPSLYRPLDLWQGTLVLDECDMANTSERSEFIHFLNCRATGTPISRQDPQNPKRTHVFCNFGLTVLTQRKQFDDNATESRCIPFYSEVTDKQLPTVETDEMLKMGLELQNKLLYLRLKFYRDVVINKGTWLNGISDPRLNASLLPLVALSRFEPSVYETIKETAKQIERLKIEEKSTSEDGIMVNLLWEKVEAGLWEVWNNPIYFVLSERHIEGQGGKENEVKIPLTVKKISEDLKWTPRRVRKVIRGLNICRQGLSNIIKVSGKAYRVIFFEPDKLEKRLCEFIVDYQPKKLYEVLGLRVTEVTQVTDNMRNDAETSQDKNFDLLYKGYVTSVTSVTAPDFLWHKIKPAERCELCGQAAVEYEINDLHSRQILRRCPTCFQKMRTEFAKAVWRHVT